METKQTIELHVQEVRKDKQVFYPATGEINGKWFKVKFTKECNTQLKEKGIYTLKVDLRNCSLERGKPYMKNDGTEGKTNPTIWVRAIDSITKYTEAEMQERTMKEFELFFNSEDIE